MNSIYSESERKDIQISSNIHAIKLQIENIKSSCDQIKRKTPTEFKFVIPKENEKLEKELKVRREKREKTLNLINEMHNEGIKQIELIEKQTNEEKDSMIQKIQYLSHKKIENKENIKNVEQEFDDVKKKLEDEIKDFRIKSFSPDQEKIIYLRNELEILNNQIESQEKEVFEKRNKLDEMTKISSKLKSFLDDKNNIFKNDISKTQPILDKQNNKIKKLRKLIQELQIKNDKLANNIQNMSQKLTNVDYLQIYKKEKNDLDDKYSQLQNIEIKKQRDIEKKLNILNEQIKSLQAMCDDHQHSFNIFNQSKKELYEKTEKMNKKNIKLTQLIKQANTELNGLKTMLKADELSTNDAKIVPVHVKTYIKLPESSLNVEQSIKNNHKILIDKISSMKLEYNQLSQKELKIKHFIEKLKQENACLKKILAPYPKIRRFFKKYLLPKNSNQNSSKIEIQTQQATISVPKLTLECKRIDIH